MMTTSNRKKNEKCLGLSVTSYGPENNREKSRNCELYR